MTLLIEKIFEDAENVNSDIAGFDLSMMNSRNFVEKH